MGCSLLPEFAVCGLIAVKENECLVCKKTSWNNKIDQSKTEYIKLMQLDLFSARIKEECQIKNHVEPEHGFKADKNWKLYI
ncbi:hypothetical protein AR687_24980 [Flavobacteriaceae bacterium CRH]|nr:hypothetical protein AR687_24980 [Flavobacteriaceae bacterium CRH]